jgi:hypothetical protein
MVKKVSFSMVKRCVVKKKLSMAGMGRGAWQKSKFQHGWKEAWSTN